MFLPTTPAKTTTNKSIIVINVVTLRLGILLFSIAPAKSVPPVVPPNLKTNPNPIPHNTPPNMADNNKSCVKTIGGKTFKKKDNNIVAYKVFIAVPLPKIFAPKINNGIFIAKFVIYIGTLTIFSITTANPVTPPGAMVFGAKNNPRL